MPEEPIAPSDERTRYDSATEDVNESHREPSTSTDAEPLRHAAFEPDLGDDDDETIGFFGKHQASGVSRYNLTKAGRRARLAQIFAIVRRYRVLHGLTPVRLRRMLEDLGPTFVKAGQILSMRSEILPERFCQELTRLRSDVEPMDYDLVREALEEEWGKPLSKVLSYIDPDPLGSASVAQVHRAVLLDGTVVAIKVQRPRVQEIMAQDIDIMRSLVRRADRIIPGEQFLDLESVVNELWETFREETDFLVEARSLREFKSNCEDCAFVDCPSPYMELCTEHVVVMDYVDGIPVAKPGKLLEQGYDLTEIGTKLVDNYATQVLDDGFFHADPHPGNLMVADGKIIFIDLGMMGRLSARYRATMRTMIFAVGEHNTPALKDGLLSFAKSSADEVDHTQLLADLDRVVAEYGDMQLEDLDIGEFLGAIINLARRNGIELPGTVTNVARGFVTLEGVIDEFLPGVSIITIISDHISAHEQPLDLAREEVERLARETHMATHGLLGAAGKADLAMEMLTRGQLKMNMDFSGSQDPIDDLSHIADRLTVGVVIAGLLVGSSMLCYAGSTGEIGHLSLVGVIGYAVGIFLSCWLGIDIYGRHRKHH